MSSEPKKPSLWTVAETADFYRVTPRTVRNWIDKGAVNVTRIGGTVRIVAPSTTSTTSA